MKGNKIMQQTLLCQLKTEASVIAGMSYVIRCSDGSVFVIDGGYDCGDAEYLLEFLKKLTGSEKPVVDSWLITHGHPDHTLALQGIAQRHSDEITVKKLIYRWPELAFIKASQPDIEQQLAVFERSIPTLGAEHIVPKKGDVWRFGDTEFEVLLACDQLPPTLPGSHTDFNDSSTVVRMKAAGQTVLFLGDVGEVGDRLLIEAHGNYLKSDVVQIAHHGYFASTSEFYDYVDPQIVLWPNTERDLPNLMKYIGVNYHLAYELDVKDCILSDFGTVCLPMPIRPSVAPYFPPASSHLKKTDPGYVIKRAPEGFDFHDADSAVWKGAERFDLLPEFTAKKRDDVSSSVRMLWDDGALYIRAEFFKPVLPSDPQRVSTTDCNNMRIYFGEKPFLDYYADWNAVRGEGVTEKLMLYPEIKPAFKAFTDQPDFCDAKSRYVPGGYVVTAKLPLVLPHSEGDLVSINVKASAVDEAGKGRSACMSMLDYDDANYVYKRPACLILAKLG